jgi:hypothetical protein
MKKKSGNINNFIRCRVGDKIVPFPIPIIKMRVKHIDN